MTNNFTQTLSRRKSFPIRIALPVVLLFLSLAFSTNVWAINTKTATTTGDWSNASIWSPVGVPSDTDNVIINSGRTITVDGDYTCRDLVMGSATSSAATLKIITGGNSLTVTGDLDFNANNTGSTYIIDAGPGDMFFNGTFSHWSTTGTSNFKIGDGSMSFTPAVAISDGSHNIIFTGAGTVNFYADFSDNQNNMTFYTGCTVNCHADYTISGSSINWGGKGTANFYGTGTIAPTANIVFNTVNIMGSASTTLGFSATGAVTVGDNLTVNSTGTFVMNDNFQLNGNFTNNGTLTAGSVTLIMKGSGTTQTIGGSSALALPTLQIGSGNGADITVAVTQNTTVAALVYATGDKSRSVTVSSGKTLTVTGNLTMNQPSKDNMVRLLSVGAGTCTVGGNLVFTGSNNNITRICRIEVGSGSFSLAGTLTWLSNSVVATEVITVTTGTVTFSSSITMGNRSGTISATSSGTINFNGSSAPSLTFGGSTPPVLSAAYGSTINIAKGLTTNTTTLTMASGSNMVFTGTGTITPNATINFANFTISASATVTAAGNLTVKGNWTNSGTFTPSTYQVTFSGTGTKSITRSGGETFYKMAVTQFGATVRLMNDVMVTNTLTMSGSNLNLNGYTLTLGNSAGAALSRSAGQAYGGTFKRWFPTSAITSTSGSYYGLFPIGTSSAYRYVGINSTVNPTTAGYVMVTHTDGTGGTNVTYTDNEGSNIQQIANQHSDITTSGLAGGTYNIEVKYTGLGSQGNVSDYKLLTYTGSTMGSCGTHVTTLGPSSAPTGKRTGLTMANLSNAWVIGTNDAAGSPLYTYVYSRKTGDWNDASGTGTWSYTAGGGGAACSCLPTAGGYAVIETGDAITVTATDTIQFLDIKTGGSLTINNGVVFNVTANMNMFGTATFTNDGELDVTGELLFSPSASQTFSGDVTVTGWFTLDSGATYTHTSGTLTVTGDMEIDGSMSLASGATIAFSGTNSILSGTGTFTTASGGVFAITNDKTVAEGTTLTIGTTGTNTDVSLGANTQINNLGSITLNGSMTGTDASSVWINNANSVLNVSGALLSTGTLDVATAPNIVHYNGTGSQNIKVPVESYHSLFASNSGTVSCPSDIVVDSVVNISGSVILDEGAYKLYGNANLVMTGTSELKLTRTTDEDVYPELRGDYLLTGGTVTITQNGDSGVINTGPYYNLKLNGTHGSDLGAVSTVSNNLDVINTSRINNNSVLTVNGMFTHSSSATSTLMDSIAVNGISITGGTINNTGYSINVKGSGGWTRNTGATYIDSTGSVYFTGTSNQTLGGTDTTQNFNNLIVDKGSNTVTVGGSTTTLSVAGNMTLNAGVFDKGTAAAINMTGGSWNNNGGSFTPGTGTVTFNSTTVDQAIQGTAGSETFNNLTVNKSGFSLAVGESITGLTLNGDMTLTAGTFSAGTATAINLTAGNWTNNGGTFTPVNSEVQFTGTGAQAVNGTAAAQTFYKLKVNKGSNTASIAGSTTSLTATSDITLAAGTFDAGTAAMIYAGGNWTNNGGSFAPGVGTVECNSGIDQAINGSASSQSFYNLTVNKAGGNLNISGSTAAVTISNTLAFTSGRIATGSNKIVIPEAATVTGAGAGNYIYGIEEIYIPNTTAPSRTFHIGDSAEYTPVLIEFTGTVSGSGSMAVHCQSGDDAAISTSGIDPGKSVNRSYTLTNNGVAGFTSYSPTYNFVAGDVDGGATPANFEIRRYSGGTWYTTTTGSRTATSTQATGETGSGRTQIGEKATLTVATHPSDTNVCDSYGAFFTSTSTSTPAPTIQWQRDPNTGTFADVDGSMDGGVYSDYTTSTLNISNVTGLNSYKYRAVFTNINGSVNSNQATLTTATTPSITGTTPDSRCDNGTVDLGATASGGTINWYAAASGGASLGTGTSYTTPSLSSTTTYYVDATSGSCTTNSRTSVTATVNPLPTASVAYQSCAGANGETTIRVSGSGGTGPYTYKINSGSFNSADSFHVANASNQNYYTQDAFGCQSSPVNYTATAVVATQIPASIGTATCACPSSSEGRDVYLTDATGNLIAIINDKGHDLGTITATAYIRASSVLIANNQGGNDAALGRSYVLDFNGTGLTPAVEVKFPFTDAEYDALVIAAAATPTTNDDISSPADIGDTQYEGPDEDSIYNTAGSTLLIYHRQLTNGTVLGGKYVTIGLSANGEHWMGGGGSGSPLPVKLVSFTATPNQVLEVVETEWVTSLEINNDYFVVERSEDGINFNEVGRLAGAGNYTGTLDYRFTDVKPFHGLSYYRLKQVDFDGDFDYSQIVAVTLGSQTSYQLYPNPSNSEVNVAVSNPSDEIKLSVYDLNGREVFGRTYSGNNAVSKNQVIAFRAKDLLAAGMYMVKVSTNGTEFKQKLVLN